MWLWCDGCCFLSKKKKKTIACMWPHRSGLLFWGFWVGFFFKNASHWFLLKLAGVWATLKKWRFWRSDFLVKQTFLDSDYCVSYLMFLTIDQFVSRSLHLVKWWFPGWIFLLCSFNLMLKVFVLEALLLTWCCFQHYF